MTGTITAYYADGEKICTTTFKSISQRKMVQARVIKKEGIAYFQIHPIISMAKIGKDGRNSYRFNNLEPAQPVQDEIKRPPAEYTNIKIYEYNTR